MNTIFKKVSIENFGGIDESSPITIIFDETYKGLTTMSGDEATGKSSVIQCLEALMGDNFSEYYVNKKTKAIGGTLEFISDGKQYKTRVTTKSFKLEVLNDVAGKEKWVGVGEDKTLIRKLLPFATSPDILQSKSGVEQVEWLKKLAGTSVDDTALAEQYKKAYSERTGKNKEVTIYKKQLIDTGLFIDESKDVVPTPQFQTLKETVDGIDIDKVLSMQDTELSDLRKKEQTLNKAKAEFETFEYQISEKQKRIKEIEEEIAQLEERKVNGKKYLDENKDLPEQVQKVETKLEETKEIKRQKENVLSTSKLYETFKNVSAQALTLTNQIDKITADRLAIAKTFTPDIPNFEVVLKTLDNEGGLFLNGINIAALSESERYSLCLQIWQHFKISVVFIENISSLGSHAMDIVQMFIANGGKVFATQMKRGKNKMSVSFSLTNEIKDITNEDEEE